VDTLGAFLCELFQVIEARKRELPAGSYVASLMQGEEMALLRKIGEEATEVLLAAVQPGQPGLVAEVADLWFHCLVVLSRYGLSLEDLKTELQARRG
jgi:phosphoribosyl-ATP pyrophosphohydrolase